MAVADRIVAAGRVAVTGRMAVAERIVVAGRMAVAPEATEVAASRLQLHTVRLRGHDFAGRGFRGAQ
jgi:hypothetical protein